MTMMSEEEGFFEMITIVINKFNYGSETLLRLENTAIGWIV